MIIMEQFMMLMIISFFQLQSGVFSQDPSCPVFGTELAATRLTDRSTSEGLIMNFDNPALCTGTVTSWRYCYYNPINTQFDENFSFGVKLLAYRRIDDGLYKVVPNSIYTVQLNFIDIQQFDCKTVTLNRNQQFQVQQNDIIGGCIIRNTTFNSLFIIGNINTGDAYQLNSPCTEEMLQSINTGSLTRLSGNTLHLSAVIDSGMTFIAGSNPPPSAVENIRGIYLNMEFPAKRDGLLTAWQYCYYTFTDPNMLRMTYTASVALWRPGNSSDQYDLVTGSITRMRLNPVATLATIYCTEMQLDSTHHTEIRQGDVVGVILPPQNPIPLIGRENVHNISRNPNQQVLSNLMLSDLRQEKIALHLYISEPGGSSTEPSSSSSTVPATELSSSSSPSLPTPIPTIGGLVAGMVVSILIVLLIVVIVVGIFIVRRRRVKRSNPADVALTEVNYREFSGPNVVTTENNIANTSNKEIELKREDNICNQAVDAAVLTEANVAYGQFTGNSIVTSENVAYGRYSTKNDSRVVSNDMDHVYELEGNYEYI